ncbi:carboxylate-amine ligase [Longispora albida]|uniref:carboxylate-amine ligase n=1 Tax=Longispora albida TaxID=203523 RepID=UPI000375B980|nr:glutamate--cysteine ligase [Longispora albida]
MELPPGWTLGVEEEFHLLDAGTGRLSPSAHLLLESVEPGPVPFWTEPVKSWVEKEFRVSMVETSTPVCASLPELREALVARRSLLVTAADQLGLLVAASGTVPDCGASNSAAFPDERFRAISDEYQHIAAEQTVCACQVQVGVPDPDQAIRVINRIRAWLPALLALSASSPYFQHVDTGYESYRAIEVSRWPTAGQPPVFADYAGYRQAVDRLIHSGVISDYGMVYYDIRPSHRYPTVEIRIADAMPRLDDVLVLAGLCRALVVTAIREDEEGVPQLDCPDELLRGALWRAARSGLRDRLVDVTAGESVPAAELLRRLLAHCQPALAELGDDEAISGGLDALLRRGTSAQRQRRVLSTGEGERAVAADVALETRAELG